MKMQKQLDTVKCLESGYYKVINGEIYTRLKGEYRLMKYCPLPTGYTQIVLSNHKRGDKNISVRVYKHIAVYIASNGTYPEGMEIDHEDRNKNNTHPDNLRAVTPVVNINNKHQRDPADVCYCARPIRGLEIDNIRTLRGAGYSQSAIARELNLNRLSVSYTIRNIIAGNKLKYEGVYSKKHDY